MNKVQSFDYLEQYAEIESEIDVAIKRVLKSGRLVLGQEVSAFEAEFAAWLSRTGEEGATSVAQDAFGVGVNSGTDALVVALMALGVGEGHEVITVANTAVPTVSAIAAAGAKAKFCDIDADTCLMDLEKIEACITDKTRAIIPVHLFGNVVDVPKLRSLVAGKNIKIIEDCAQSHGATLNGVSVGTMGDIGAFSFYPTKNLGAYGDAGLCLSSDANLAELMRSVRMYGFTDRQYCVRPGINSRLDELQAAILRVKLSKLDHYIERCRAIAGQYLDQLHPSIQVVRPSLGAQHAYHQFVIKLSNRDAVKQELEHVGISTAIHYPWPLHTMSGFSNLNYVEGDLPVTEASANQILSLPIYPEMNESQLEQVCSAINQLVDELAG